MDQAGVIMNMFLTWVWIVIALILAAPFLSLLAIIIVSSLIGAMLIVVGVIKRMFAIFTIILEKKENL